MRINFFLICAGMIISFVSQADLLKNNTSGVQENSKAISLEPCENENSKWFWFISLVNPYPKMESEKPVKELFDPIMVFLAPDQEPVKTVSDFRDNHLIWAPHAGIGYQINSKWSITAQGGGEGGKIRTKQTHPSILLMPLHTDFEIKRMAFYFGIGIHFSPWGSPIHKDFESWKERIKATRPYLSASATYTYATYDAKVKVKFLPLLYLVDLNLSDEWNTVSLDTNIGFEIPINKKDEFVVSLGYSKFARLREDFDSFTFTIEFKRFLQKKK
ncbi:MAG: hypothetical protein ACP5UA_04000 [Candidatus Hydrogenedens sp.]